MKKLLAILLSLLFIAGTFAVVNATEYYYDGSKDIPGYLNFYIDSDMVKSTVITKLDLVINWKLRPDNEDKSGLLDYTSFIESASFDNKDNYTEGVLKFSFSDNDGIDLSASKTFLTLTFSRNKYFIFSHDDIVDYYVDGYFTDINGNDYSKRNVIKTELDAEYDTRETDAMLEGHMSVNNIGITESTESTVTEPSSETQMTAPATEPSTATEPTETSTSTPIPNINKTKASVKAGGTVALKVTDGTVKTWSTSNKKVATVSNGKVTGLKKGTATITAALTTGKKLTCKVTVTTSPKLSKSSVSVKKGKTVSVKITGKALTVKNVYTNTKYAKVTSKNTATTIKVKGLKKGSTTLKIKVNGVMLKLKVKVK